MNEVLEGLAKGSRRQIAPEVAERLRTMARDGYTADEILGLLDTLIYGHPANPFLAQALRMIIESKQREEGGVKSSR